MFDYMKTTMKLTVIMIKLKIDVFCFESFDENCKKPNPIWNKIETIIRAILIQDIIHLSLLHLNAPSPTI